LSSAYDQVSEAELQASLVPEGSRRAWIYGAGTGEVPCVLLRRREMEKMVVVIMNPAVAVQSFRYFDHAEWLSDSRVELSLAETDAINIRLNCRRGLAIDALWFKDISEHWLCGTMHHGYYDDINWGADYYTGHLVLESPGHRKITDLEPVEDMSVAYEHDSESIRVQGKIQLDCGYLYKSFRIHRRKDQSFIDINYQLDWSKPMVGSLRLGYITINPEAFSQQNLFYATHNGGHELEYFKITEPINHGEAVSFLISAKHVLGCTSSIIKLGDHRHHINVIVDKSASNQAGMIHYQKIGDSYICRLIWSAREMDDTSRTTDKAVDPLRCSVRVYAHTHTQLCEKL